MLLAGLSSQCSRLTGQFLPRRQGHLTSFWFAAPLGSREMSTFETYESKGATTLSPLGASAWVTTTNLRDSGTDHSESLPTPTQCMSR